MPVAAIARVERVDARFVAALGQLNAIGRLQLFDQIDGASASWMLRALQQVFDFMQDSIDLASRLLRQTRFLGSLHIRLQQCERAADHLLLQTPSGIVANHFAYCSALTLVTRVAIDRSTSPCSGKVHAILLQSLQQCGRCFRQRAGVVAVASQGVAGFPAATPARRDCPRRCCDGPADGCNRRSRRACRRSWSAAIESSARCARSAAPLATESLRLASPRCRSAASSCAAAAAATTMG